MLSHRLDRGVLVLTVLEDPGIGGRAELAAGITAFVRLHQPAPVHVIIGDRAAAPATVSAVLRAHRQCEELGVTMSAATRDPAVRRLLEAGAVSGEARFAVRPRIGTAISTGDEAAA
ncbi:MAG TPA: hypothetical protein VN520_02535 [Streptomyces sp.]|uniref:hypothetical protein n=1 Tax=Streptomyces sp. TaxID=1931 RepID=UPI002CC543E2|nr:hypothetical protein [Streptomyces sp.]HWU05277.1 hypothetical protein [Streptomyces sp.]